MIDFKSSHIESGCRSYAGLNPGALFPANIPALLPDAAFIVTGDFCVFGSRQIQKNLVSVGCSMLGLAYRNSLATVGGFTWGWLANAFQSLSFSNPHILHESQFSATI